MGEVVMSIYCCGCCSDVEARLTDGSEVYSHRKDLYSLPFWKCDSCGNFVGCHHKTKNRTKPLGCIPTKEIKKARQDLHKVIDPLWKSGTYGRREIYKLIGHHLGYEYHTANIKSLDEANKVMSFVLTLAK